MSFWKDDVDEFFHDFASTVTLYPDLSGETDIQAIFDEAQEVIDMDTGQVINARPRIGCKSTDIVGVIEGNEVKIDAHTYKVRQILDDGTGITMLVLSEN